MRLFVAIDFDEHKNYFLSLQQKLAGGSFTFPKVFHLTIKFLGEVEDPKPVIDALSKVSFDRFSLVLSGFGVFPDKSSIRVVWVGLNPIVDVANLHSQVDSLLGNPDSKWHPHITIARVKFIKDNSKISALLAHETEPLATEVKSFSLYKSSLTSSGPIYERLAEFKSSKVI
ncbi:MAG: RNA 2',3'-cyclic phosphodiesterase [Candidatus Woesearchaeota archaeon]